ncbi:hypothetical protein [Candidatus Magnetaquicoccus inordinatus]|uniref:hypothetical protein n=1 Tax=Candidatus Magnetaquicoccus inordinatus TaxID=2496818 RepID=UPI00102C0D12|nr:hypothetical protein [Candidatus Magnetaquicoccus inordinatus]
MGNLLFIPEALKQLKQGGRFGFATATAIVLPEKEPLPAGKQPTPKTAAEFRQAFGVWPWNIDWMKPHHGRASLLPEVIDGQLWHWCCDCGRWGLFGTGVYLRNGKLGEWQCGLHK